MKKGEQSEATRASIAWLATQSRPGSLEARRVHGCTCVPSEGRALNWDPERPQLWWCFAISADCPAHAKLRGLSPRVSFRSPVYRRSFTERLGDAIQGWLLGWRGDL